MASNIPYHIHNYPEQIYIYIKMGLWIMEDLIIT